MPSSDPSHHLPVRVSLMPLIAGLLAAPFLGGLLGLGLAIAGGWHSVTSSWTPLQTVAAAAGCWIMAALIGLLLTSIISKCEARKIPAAILVASAVRAGVALFDGLFVMFIYKPDPKTFWTAFLLCGLLCLVIETAWALLVLRRVNASLEHRHSAPVGVS